MTANVLSEYQEMIKDAKSDLEERLQNIDSQLRALVQSSQGEAEEQVTRKERESIQQCLDICTGVSAHIEEVQSSTFRDIFTPASEHHDHVATASAASARLVTEGALRNCKDTLTTASSELRYYLEDARRRLGGLSQPGSTDPAEQRKMQDEIDIIKESLALCTEASEKAAPSRISTYNRVSLGEDSHQLVVSTFGDLINARDVSAGARSTQWIGQISDGSLQQLSRDRHRVISKTMVEQAAEEKAEEKAEERAEDAPKFEHRYGQGRPLQHYEA